MVRESHKTEDGISYLQLIAGARKGWWTAWQQRGNRMWPNPAPIKPTLEEAVTAVREAIKNEHV